jgi:Zn-dependent protease with chaperone function
MIGVLATYFNGRDATAYAVTIGIDGASMVVSGDGIDRREPFAAVQISEAIGNAPRLVRFSDAAFCEVTDNEGLGRLLAEHGVMPSRVSQWESSLGWIAAGGVAFIALLIAGYFYGIPILARVVANRVPAVATNRLSAEVLAIFDGQLFVPSVLSKARQQELDAAFRRLVLPASARGAAYELLFRKSDVIGANALALPSGTIIVTDALVELARDDREILGVLAHEAGHVDHRHGLRNILQNSIVGLVVAWFIGDVSSIAAAAPTALIEASYSRELEREADLYAMHVLRANNIPLRHLADILRRLDGAHDGSEVSRTLGYLSSHPATSERLRQLEAPPP